MLAQIEFLWQHSLDWPIQWEGRGRWMIIDLPTLGHCLGSIFREMQISRPSVQHVILMCHYFTEVWKKTCRPHMRRNLFIRLFRNRPEIKKPAFWCKLKWNLLEHRPQWSKFHHDKERSPCSKIDTFNWNSPPPTRLSQILFGESFIIWRGKDWVIRLEWQKICFWKHKWVSEAFKPKNTTIMHADGNNILCGFFAVSCSSSSRCQIHLKSASRQLKLCCSNKTMIPNSVQRFKTDKAG